MNHKLDPWQAFIIVCIVTLVGYAFIAWVLAFLITFVFGVSFGFLDAAGLVVIVVIIGGLLRKGGE